MAKVKVKRSHRTDFRFFTENGNFYLVEEYIEGSSFQSKLEPGVFYSEKEVVFLLENILETLVILHSYKLIIFYLKPENIIVKDDHQSILLDTVGIFRCIANQVIQPESMGLSFQDSLIYRVPEQNLQKLQENVDIYSLGIIAVQAVTGLNDFQLTQIIKAKASIERNMWRKELPNSLAIVAILEKMIHPLSERRYPSALDVLSELEQLGFYRSKELPVLLIPATKGEEQLIEKLRLPPSRSQGKRGKGPRGKK
ncbi:MAG: hypothetical protein HC796_12215 [Synechococcaceae cyanobacterium RL_1_2]|nr:hypothetical protein [Synechococcaceae cyanobacterium RL_1_2]